ncbi:hypothetical protein F66182_16186, partial [Fusarium sp. NRRL 66182]
MPVTVSEVRQMVQETTTPAVTSVEPSPMSTPPTKKADKRSDIFTVKEVAPRHKRKAVEAVEVSDETSSSGGSSESESESSSSSEEESEEEIQVQKPPTKKSRKEKKLQRKPQEEDTIPFDYGAASSVLHSEDIAAAVAAANLPNQKKYFNPYAKSLNAPSG